MRVRRKLNNLTLPMTDSVQHSNLLLVSLAYYLNSCTRTTVSAGLPKTPPDDSSSALNSERIARKFSSYAIQGLAAIDNYRLANLYSTHDGVDTTRTLALVKFEEQIPAQLRMLHQQILNGASIGATFKNAGWHIEKKPIRKDVLLHDSAYASIYQTMRLDNPMPLAMYVYAFHISKGNREFRYAGIVEIYHPDYLTQEKLPDGPVDFQEHASVDHQMLVNMLNELVPATLN